MCVYVSARIRECARACVGARSWVRARARVCVLILLSILQFELPVLPQFGIVYAPDVITAFHMQMAFS